MNDHRLPPGPEPVHGTLAAALRAAGADLQQQPLPPDLQARVLAAAAAAQALSAASGMSAAAPTLDTSAATGPAAAPALPTPPAVLAGRGPQASAHEGRRAAARAQAGTGWPGLRSLSAWSGAAACAVVLAGSALLMLQLPAPAPQDDAVRMSGFFPLVPPERWPQDAAPAWLVSTEVSSARLAALGLPYDPARAGDSVRAELLLHPSGEVLAVRFLR